MDVLEMAQKIRDGEEQQASIWVLLHLFKWGELEQRIKRHAMMVKMGMQMPDPVYQTLMMIGVALGKIEDGEPERTLEESTEGNQS